MRKIQVKDGMFIPSSKRCSDVNPDLKLRTWRICKAHHGRCRNVARNLLDESCCWTHGESIIDAGSFAGRSPLSDSRQCEAGEEQITYRKGTSLFSYGIGIVPEYMGTLHDEEASFWNRFSSAICWVHH